MRVLYARAKGDPTRTAMRATTSPTSPLPSFRGRVLDEAYKAVDMEEWEYEIDPEPGETEEDAVLANAVIREALQVDAQGNAIWKAGSGRVGRIIKK